MKSYMAPVLLDHPVSVDVTVECSFLTLHTSISELSMGWLDPRVGSGRIGSGRVQIFQISVSGVMLARLCQCYHIFMRIILK